VRHCRPLADRLRSVPANSGAYALRLGVLLGAWVVFTGIVVVAGIFVVHSSAIAAFDNHITSIVVAHRTHSLNQAMKAITWLGSWVALVAAAAVLVVLAARDRIPWIAVLLAVVAWVGEVGAVALAKHLVQRQRPPMHLWLKTAHGWSWPSGHTANASLVCVVLAVVAADAFRSSGSRAAIWAVAAVATAAVGFSRIELGVHWTTDVLASLVFVSGWVLAIVILFGTELRNPRSHSLGEPLAPIR
jgi:membrane-associated phospholipid phosphatase